MFLVEGRKMKEILEQILNRLADLAASVDALEAELETNGGLKKGAIGNRFRTHKQIVESHLVDLRAAVSQIQE